MFKKYHSTEQVSIITNDLYMAAYLHCEGCRLEELKRNDRRRVSFVFIGDRVRHLRNRYQNGVVSLNLRSFRDSLLHIRRMMDS